MSEYRRPRFEIVKIFAVFELEENVRRKEVMFMSCIVFDLEKARVGILHIFFGVGLGN
ncbi:MAG: hypothetical protein ACRD6X_06325 [Pyrinomonadaceae bacterium]